MSRNTEHQFISTDTEEVKATVVALWERFANTKLHAADPMMLLSMWVADLFVRARADINFTGNQNLPSAADGENLDALADLYYLVDRPDATPATCTVRFYITEAQSTPTLVPAGTRCTDQNQTLYWVTEEDAYIEAGSMYVDLPVECQTAGEVGNGWAAGSINTIVDVYDYYDRCESLTESSNGSDRLTDDEFYEVMRASQDAYSTAGPHGAYEYFAKIVSPDIADVVANSPSPGIVAIHALMNDGQPAGEETKRAIYEVCSAIDRRPLTDFVKMADPEQVDCEIEFTYWLTRDGLMSASDVADMVQVAVDEYILWQTGKLGRDINPSYLHSLLMGTGAKRIEITKPVFTHLEDGRPDYKNWQNPDYAERTPQVAKIDRDKVVIHAGGYEDE